MRLTERTGRDSTLYEDARRYDRLTAALSGAGPVEFYRKLAQHWGDPVLELACGTGRIAIPLAQSGAFVAGKGNPLYNERSTRVVCLDADGKLKQPIAELPTSRFDPPAIPFDAVKTMIPVNIAGSAATLYLRIGFPG